MDTTIQGISLGLKNRRIQGVECILSVEFGALGSGFGFGALGLGFRV